MNPTVLRGLAAPAAVALLTAIIAIAFGAAAALGVLAVGSAAIVAFHLVNLDRLASWAADPRDDRCPRGGQAGACPSRRFIGAFAHATLCSATSPRDRALPPSVAEAIPDGMVVLDAANRVEWANAARRCISGSTSLATSARRSSILRASRHSSATSSPETTASPSCSIRSARQARRCRSQIVPFGIEEKLLISRDITQLEAVRSNAPRFHCQRVARAEDAADRRHRFHRDAAGHGARAAAARRYLQLMHEQAQQHEAAGR